MMKRSVWFMLCLLLPLCQAVSAAGAGPEAAKVPAGHPGAEEGLRIGRLVVYSDDMMFVVKEPEGWVGDTENAKHSDAAVMLYPATEGGQESGVVVAVRVARKVDENTREDLNYDMQGFRERFPDAKFGEVAVKHPSYKVFAKAFTIPKSRYEYVAFLNPGKKVPFLFTVVMQTGKKKATKEELAVFREIVASVEYISQEGVKPPARPNRPGAAPK